MISNLVAVLITTNLVYHPCTCGFCRVDRELGIAVCIPEHLNAVGYDCDWVVSTQYLPVVERPAAGLEAVAPEPEGMQWTESGEEAGR